MTRGGGRKADRGAAKLLAHPPGVREMKSTTGSGERGVGAGTPPSGKNSTRRKA